MCFLYNLAMDHLAEKNRLKKLKSTGKENTEVLN